MSYHRYDVTDPAQAVEYLLRFKCWAKSDASVAIRTVCEDHLRLRTAAQQDAWLMGKFAEAARSAGVAPEPTEVPKEDYVPEHRHQCECGHHVSVHEAGHRPSPNRCIIGDCPCTEYRGAGVYR